MNSNTNILITGGAGYLGSVLTFKLLEEGFSVTVLDNMIFNQNSLLNCCNFKNFDFVKGDIANFNLIKDIISGFDIVIPLAGIVGAPACAINPNLTKRINLDAQRNIISCLGKQQTVLFPTTNSGYGKGDDEKCTEESPLNPLSEYAQHKVLIENEFLENCNSITFRLATVFGNSFREIKPPRSVFNNVDLFVTFFKNSSNEFNIDSDTKNLKRG